MGAAVATQRTLDVNAVSKELRGLGAATRKRVLDAVRAGELRPHMLLNTTPKDLARLGFAGDALQDVQVALASVRQGETDRLAAIEARKERERVEAGRAAREAEEAARREAEAAAAALAKRNDAWRSQRATVDAFEQLVRTQRHVLAAHPTSIFQVAVAQADPLQAAPGAAGSGSGAHLFRSTRHSEALADFAHLRPCLGGGNQWAKRVRQRRARGGALADELSSSSSSSSSSNSSSSDGCRAPLRLAWPVRCVAVAAEPGVGCIVSGGGSDPAALALGIEAAAAELAVWDARKGELVHLLPKPPQPVGTARTQRAGAATGSAGSSSSGGGNGGGTRGGIVVSAPAVLTSVLGEDPRALRVANSASSEAAAAAAAAEAVEEERPPAHTGPVRCVAITPDASFCVSGGEDGNVLVWRVSSGQCVCRMGAEASSGGTGAHAAPVESVALSADGRSVVSAAFTPPRAVAAATSGASLLGGGFGGIGIGGGRPLRHGHPDPPSPPSPRLGADADASATADAAAAGRVPLSSTVEVCVWEVVEHTPEDVAPGSPGASFVHWPLPRGAAKGPCVSRMLVPAGAYLRGVAAGGAAAGARVAMSRSGAWLVVGTARVLNLYDGEGQVSGLAWGGGGSAAASDDDDAAAAAAAAEAGAATGAAALPSSHFCSLDMSPDADGRFVVTGHGGGAGSGGADAGSGLGGVSAGGGFVQLWDRASWSRLRVFAHSAPVHSVSFSSLAPADERAAAEQGSSSSSADLEGEGLGHLRVCSASEQEVCVWHAYTGRNVVWHQLQVGSGRATVAATATAATAAASPSESTSPADRAASPTASADDVDDVDDWRVEEMTGSPPPALGTEDGTAPAAGGAMSSDSEDGSEGDDTWSAHGGGQSFMAGETGDDTFGSAACALSPEASEASPRQLVDGGEDGGALAVGGAERGDEVAGERISCIAACGGGMVVLGTQLLSSSGISALAAETTGPEVPVATRGRIFMHMLTEPLCE